MTKAKFSSRGKRILTPPKKSGGQKGVTLPGSERKTGREPLLILNPKREYGPAMARLTDPRKRFVLAYVWTGGRNGQQAAIMAGIGGNDANSASEACHLLGSDSILDAIREETDKYWRAGVLKCAVELDKLIDSENERVKLDAIKAYLGYAGVIVAQHITVKHEHTLEDLSGDELIARLVELRQKNNLIEYKPDLPVLEVRESENAESINAALMRNPVVIDAAVLDGYFVELQEAA